LEDLITNMGGRYKQSSSSDIQNWSMNKMVL